MRAHHQIDQGDCEVLALAPTPSLFVCVCVCARVCVRARVWRVCVRACWQSVCSEHDCLSVCDIVSCCVLFLCLLASLGCVLHSASALS